MSPDLAAQLTATTELVSKREDMGDEVETPRSVDHMIRVPRAKADSLVGDLQAAGFRVYNRKGWLKVSVEFDRDDAVDQKSAAVFTREVFALAEQHGGQYDGWGGMVLPRGREAYVPPDDLMAREDVDVEREQSRLRDLYARRLVDDGCPGDEAAELGRRLALTVGADSWGLGSPDGRMDVMGQFSPSVATERAIEMADMTVEDNRERRRPRWTPKE